jgi:anti-anti-sigma factor
MEIQVEKNAGIGIVNIQDSKLDQSNLEEFFKRMDLLMDKTCNIVLNLENLEFIDSSGLSGFAHILRRVEEKNGRFCVCCVGEMVKDAFDLAHIDRVLDIYDTQEDALASFSAAE